MMKWFERGWRLFWTGLAFAFFGIGGLLLSLTVFPLISLLVRDEERRTLYAQWLVHKAFQCHVLFMTCFGVIGVRIIGAEKLAEDRGALIVSNHPSLLDVVLLISVMKRAQCIVKFQIWRNPFLRGVVNAAGYIRNDNEPEKLIEDCARELHRGANILIFPEGSRTVPGVPVKLLRGVANIAIRANAPIRLVTIKCDPPSLMKGQKWYEIPPVRSRFTITVHGLIEMKRFIGDSSPTIAARHLNAYLVERLTGDIGVDRT